MQASEKSSKNVESSSKASETPKPAVYSIYPNGGVYDGIERCLEDRDSARSSGIGSTGIACRGRFWGRRTSGIADNWDSGGTNDGDCENRLGFLV